MLVAQAIPSLNVCLLHVSISPNVLLRYVTIVPAPEINASILLCEYVTIYTWAGTCLRQSLVGSRHKEERTCEYHRCLGISSPLVVLPLYSLGLDTRP